MPVYEYYCRACHDRFERLRPLREAEQPAVCPAGHTGAERALSLFAVRRDEGAALPAAGGGCCGGGCACGSAGRN